MTTVSNNNIYFYIMYTKGSNDDIWQAHECNEMWISEILDLSLLEFLTLG